MSRFSILRVDDYDPVAIGKRTRITYAIYAAIPFIGMQIMNILFATVDLVRIGFYVSIPLIAGLYFILLKKVRSTINNLKIIGEIEITQSCIRKRLGDIETEYRFDDLKEVRLIKHIPATRLREGKNRYYSYILKISPENKPEESLVVTDRSIDHNHKISVADTLKTLKKLVPFEVILET